MANEVLLQEGHPLSENLRPLKVGGESSSLEIAQWGDGARVNGDLIISGNISDKSIQSSPDDDLFIQVDGFIKISSGGVDSISMTPAAYESGILMETDDVILMNLDGDVNNNVVIARYPDTTDGGSYKALHIDYAKSGNSEGHISTGIDLDMYSALSEAGTNFMKGLDISCTLTMAADAGVVLLTGANIVATGSTNGASTITGLDVTATGGDSNTGIVIRCDDDGTALKIISETIVDYFTINTIDDGETTFTTFESGGGASAHMNFVADGNFDVNAQGDIDLSADGANKFINFKAAATIVGYVNADTAATFHLLSSSNYHLKLESQGNGDINLDSSGDIILDSADGNFIAKEAGTEFSVANSAYAGMILGYRIIGEDALHASYTLTNSFAVPHSDMTVRFIVPPSGKVEVMVQILCNASTNNRMMYFGLSDNATYNTIGVQYEQIAYYPDESDDNVVQHNWAVTGLTPGDTVNYWFGAKINFTAGYLNWGGNSSGRYCDFIMKVTALPEATANIAVYG